MITLRDYQAEAVQSIFDYFTSGNKGNPVVALPTGTGKSLVIAEFCRRVLHHWPNQKIMVVTHVKELIEQNAKAMLKVWPTAPVGIYSAGLSSRDTMQSIIFGGVQSIVGAQERFKLRHLMLIDEAHLVSPDAETMYQKVIRNFQVLNPNFKTIGFTATAYRTGQGPIAGTGKLFTDVCYDRTDLKSFNWFIDQGYIVPLIPKRTMTEYDVSNLSIVGGDYSQSQAQKAFDEYGLTYQCCREIIEYASTRKSWLIFASGVEHSEHVAQCLQTLGIHAVAVHSKMNKADRDERIISFKNGSIRCVVNNGVLTTGFDYPGLDCIAMMRATTSTGLWVQMLGRGTRPLYAFNPDNTKESRLAAIAASRKHNCLVLDFAGNTRRLGPINDPLIPAERVKGSTPGVAPIKICPKCGVYCHASATRCDNPACDQVFERQAKLASEASKAELIRSDAPIVEEFKVDKVLYTKTQLKGKPPMMKVSYFCGFDIHKEVLCFEHTGSFARTKARKWWRERSTEEPPETVDNALKQQRFLREPRAVKLAVNVKYPEITPVW